MDYISDSADMDVGKTQSLPTKGLKLREMEGKDGNKRWKLRWVGAASEAMSSKLGAMEGGAPLCTPSPFTTS